MDFAHGVLPEDLQYEIRDMLDNRDAPWVPNKIVELRERLAGSLGPAAVLAEHVGQADLLELKGELATLDAGELQQVRDEIREAIGLPIEALGVLLVFDRILDMCRTTVNVWGDAVDSARNLRNCGEDGSVLVSHSMAELLSGKADLAPLGPHGAVGVDDHGGEVTI